MRRDVPEAIGIDDGSGGRHLGVMTFRAPETDAREFSERRLVAWNEGAHPGSLARQAPPPDHGAGGKRHE